MKSIRKIILFCLMSMLILCGGCSSLGFTPQTNLDTSVDMTPRKISLSQYASAPEVVENVKSAVVGISASLSNGYSVGSGVAIAENGYILTNHHVVDSSNQITVYFADMSQASAKLVWSDSSLDMAVIKSSKNMPYLDCGNSKNLKVGEEVLAIGTPLTLQFKHTVTKGIISALNRTLEVDSMGGASYLQNLIQHDASINPGNSGGPLITLDGKVVGINTLKASEGEGIGFAIPIEVGQKITEKVVQNNNYVAPYIGVFGFDADIASYYGETDLKKGVYVISLDKYGSASLSGLQEGDVILKINGKDIERLLDLKMAMYDCNIGMDAVMTIQRGEQIFELKVPCKTRQTNLQEQQDFADETLNPVDEILDVKE